MVNFIIFDKTNNERNKIFYKLFKVYFIELFGNNTEVNMTDKEILEAFEYFKNGMVNELYWIYFCSLDNEIIGFVIAQIDTPEKDWCQKQGWGFIREFFINLPYRKKGYAKLMCKFIEDIFIQNKANKAYITSDDELWEKLGYKYLGEIDKITKQKIFIKDI